MQLFTVDSLNNVLKPIPSVSAVNESLGETSHLEAWIRTQDNIFDRKKLLWLSRQERTEQDQRADLLGTYADELILVELKRGRVDKFAVSQALAYLAKHATDDRKTILDLFKNQAAKNGEWALLPHALSSEDAEKRFNEFSPEGEDFNQFRTIILLGDDFDPETLQICNLLNESARTDGLLTFECWCLCLFKNADTYFCAFDKLLPSKDLNDEIEQRRSELLIRKGKRNPDKIEFMKMMKSSASERGIEVEASRGESYACRFSYKSDEKVTFFIHENPMLWFPKDSGSYDSGAFSKIPNVTINDNCFVLTSDQIRWDSAEDKKKAANQILDALGILFRLPKKERSSEAAVPQTEVRVPAVPLPVAEAPVNAAQTG
jgi:hypothetical protein